MCGSFLRLSVAFLARLRNMHNRAIVDSSTGTLKKVNQDETLILIRITKANSQRALVLCQAPCAMF